MPIFEFRDKFHDMRLVGSAEAATIIDALTMTINTFPWGPSGVEFAGHDMTGVPTVQDPDLAILMVLDHAGNELLADRWHGDHPRAHSRGGWVIHLAGGEGHDLEDRFGPKVAASLIYAASCPGLSVPNWHLYGDAADEDMRARAHAWGSGPPYPDIPVGPMVVDPWTHEKWMSTRASTLSPRKAKKAVAARSAR